MALKIRAREEPQNKCSGQSFVPQKKTRTQGLNKEVVKDYLALSKANRSEAPSISLHLSRSAGQQASGPWKTAETRSQARLEVSPLSHESCAEVENEEAQFHNKGKKQKVSEELYLRA